MRFGVLGPLAVWTAAGEPVGVPGLKVRTLLAALLVNEGRAVSADRLVEDLWGESPTSNPAGALSAKVSQLRRVLEDAEQGGRELVGSGPAGYLLRTGQDAVDAQRFRSLTARARQSGDPRGRADLLSDALALWRGRAFDDFGDEPFAQAAIARLTEERLTAQESHVEARLALGEHTELAGELGDLLAENPLRERLRAAHLRALYGAGRQVEALASYDDLRTRLAGELGLDPGPDLVALHRAILTQDPALDTPPARRPAPATNLPASLTDLIGREDAVAGIRARLGTDRLLTLTGPGGVGKTRLATETAAQLLDSYADGVWLVELAGFERTGTGGILGSLTDEVRSALDIRDATAPGEPVDPVGRLTGALRSRQLLLVLDNCEHLVEQVAELAELLLGAAPGIRVLATSREPLGLTGEVVWPVPPLDLPAPATDPDPSVVARSSAVRLFVTRAAAASQGFALDRATAGPVAILCRRLDGIPLALELAATRVRALGVDGLVARLDDRFRLLAVGHRGAPPRQQTLMAMIDWSWDLLAEPERIVLRRLAVHVDGCAMEAAEAVCAGDDLAAGEVLDLLSRLVDRSLVTVVHGAGGPRYRLLESVAAYCVDRLDDAGESDEVRGRHLRYYAGLAERAEPHLHGKGQRHWLRLLDAETANLRAALAAAVADRDPDTGLRLVSSLAWYWFLRGRLTEARRSLDAALDIPGEAPAAVLAAASAWRAGMALLTGDTTDQAARRDAVLRMYDDVDDPAGRARAQWFLAYASVDTGDLPGGSELLDTAVAAFRSIGDRWGLAAALLTRVRHAHVRGDLAALRHDSELSAELFGELGDRWGLLQATEWLAALAELVGDLEGAARQHQDGLRMAEELELWPDVASRLSWLGWIAMQQGDYPRARELCGQGLRLAGEQGMRSVEIFAGMGLAFAARKDGALDVAETQLRRILEWTPPDDGVPPPYLPNVLTELGFICEQRGDAAAAMSLQVDAFAAARRLEAPRDIAVTLEGIAGAVGLSGRHDRAARLLGAAEAVRTSAGLPMAPAERADVERITAAAYAVLGAADFASEYEAGAQLTPDEAADGLHRVPATGSTKRT